jgi:hypothetical protein
LRIDKAIIYETLTARDRIVRDSRSGRLTIIAVDNPEALPEIATRLASEGVRLIELCGGISPVWRHKVTAAVGGKARVSSVTFGIESLPSAAAYSAAYMAGEVQQEAFIFLESDADANRDRFRCENTTFIPVPDDDIAARVADELCNDGVALIELYGGFTTHGIAKVIEAVNARAPVGAGSFAIDALDRTVWPLSESAG